MLTRRTGPCLLAQRSTSRERPHARSLAAANLPALRPVKASPLRRGANCVERGLLHTSSRRAMTTTIHSPTHPTTVNHRGAKLCARTKRWTDQSSVKSQVPRECSKQRQGLWVSMGKQRSKQEVQNPDHNAPKIIAGEAMGAPCFIIIIIIITRVSISLHAVKACQPP